VTQHDEDEDDDFDPEGPDRSEMDYSDEADLEVCPHCRKLITEEADRCPHCGEYITLSAAPFPLIGWIFVIALVIALLVLVLSRGL
jgi:hypothetical protein